MSLTRVPRCCTVAYVSLIVAMDTSGNIISLIGAIPSSNHLKAIVSGRVSRRKISQLEILCATALFCGSE